MKGQDPVSSKPLYYSHVVLNIIIYMSEFTRLCAYVCACVCVCVCVCVFQVALVIKNPPFNAGDAKDPGLIPGSGRSPGGGRGNLLQYSCLENPMDRGTWGVTVLRVSKSRMQLKKLSTHAHTQGKQNSTVFVSVGFGLILPGFGNWVLRSYTLKWSMPLFPHL